MRDLVWDNGVLSFSQVLSEAHRESEEARAEAEEGTKGLYAIGILCDPGTLDPSKGVSIKFNRQKHKLEMFAGLDPKGAVAWGYMVDNLAKTGWIELYLEATASGSYTNDVKIYAAGYLEGILTAARMSQFYSNGHQILVKDSSLHNALKNLKKMFSNEIGYLKKNCNFHAGVLSKQPKDYYWAQARFVLFQVFGIRDGYNEIADIFDVHPVALTDMWAINNHGIMPELLFEYLPAEVYARRKYQEALSLLAKWSPAATRRLRGNRGPLGQLVADHLTPPSHSGPPHAAHPPHALAVLQGKGVTSDHEGFKSNYEVLNPVTGKPYPVGRKANSTELAAAERHWENRVQKYGHCSAFIRITSEAKELIAGHSTWDDYCKMTRMWKYYKFKFKGSHNFANHIAMSSYPGCVSSTDNFYMLSSGLLVMDTNLEILNPKLYQRLPEFPANAHLPTWMHVMVTNRIARSGSQWAIYYAEQNNGQDNAQWMVLDYNLFSPGGGAPDNMFWLVETIPGMTQKADLSEDLESNGYFASYNRPYFDKCREMTGHAAAEAFYGALFSYGGNPRASIFASIAPNVESLFDVRNLMRRNEFPSEGVTPNAPGHAIAARNDLDPVNLLPNGAIDAKVTNNCLFAALQCQAQSGPTHDTQQVFRWRDGSGKDIFPGWPHLGLPDSWDFDWVQMTPSKVLDPIIDQNSC